MITALIVCLIVDILAIILFGPATLIACVLIDVFIFVMIVRGIKSIFTKKKHD